MITFQRLAQSCPPNRYVLFYYYIIWHNIEQNKKQKQKKGHFQTLNLSEQFILPVNIVFIIILLLLLLLVWFCSIQTPAVYARTHTHNKRIFAFNPSPFHWVFRIIYRTVLQYCHRSPSIKGPIKYKLTHK